MFLVFGETYLYQCFINFLASVGGAIGGQPQMLGSPKEMSTEEMRKLLERNEVINPGNGTANLQPYDTVNV